MRLKKLALTLVLLAGAGAASAASYSYAFNSTSVTGFGAPSFGSVLLTERGTSVDVSVSLRSDMNFVSTGNANSHALFTFNATGVSLSDISGLSSGTPDHTLVAYVGGRESSFGSFSFGIRCSNCANGAGGQTADALKFTVAGASAADFMSLSSGGTRAFFAADVISGSTTGAIGATGGGISPVPEAESYALMLAGLAALGFVVRRRQKN